MKNDDRIMIKECQSVWIVKNEKEIRAILVENFLAVEVENYLCRFYTENEPNFSCTKSLREAISILPDYFVRINRRCIVNVKKIKSIDLKNQQVQLPEGKFFPYSEYYFKILKDKFYRSYS